MLTVNLSPGGKASLTSGHWTSFQLLAVEREEQADPFSRGGGVDWGQQNPSEAGVRACFLGEALSAAPGQAWALTLH